MNQHTICAKVNPRLLTKADRLFTGTIDGRIIEILQNARRAGAREVRISNKDGFVTIQDNGWSWVIQLSSERGHNYLRKQKSCYL